MKITNYKYLGIFYFMGIKKMVSFLLEIHVFLGSCLKTGQHSIFVTIKIKNTRMLDTITIYAYKYIYIYIY